ncbi:MAG: DegT/DnrJ/EryC1/StrS family aminotransferase [Gammaproteobacteria bacterium]|jgi:perosamine synthetase|nr:DegT/DnrJ/EryC1/StrS family aminotransferase [Gammaproteobacteria bacterium]
MGIDRSALPWRIPMVATDIRAADRQAVAAVLEGDLLSQGPRLAEFERRCAEIAGRNHGVGFSSGTAALHLLLHCLELQPGDEVITTPFTVPAVADAILSAGGHPVFADIDDRSWNLDPERVAEVVTPRTRALVVVHTFGAPAAVEELRAAVGGRSAVNLIEDACQAIGARYAGRPAGAQGDSATFAFFPNKPVTLAEGGVAVCDDPQLAARLARLRNHGRDPAGGWLDQAEVGFNYRLNEMQCALGLGQLARLDQISRRRDARAARYRRQLADCPGLVLPQAPAEGDRHAWFCYPLRLTTAASRDGLVAGMAERGIQCGRYFAPLHQQPALRRLGYGEADLPVCSALAPAMLALPLNSRISDEQVDEVCEVLRGLLVGR